MYLDTLALFSVAPLKMCLILVVFVFFFFWKVLIKIYDGNKNIRLVWKWKPFFKLKISQTKTCDVISSDLKFR